MRRLTGYICLVIIFCSSIMYAQGKVYLVLGSDTGIWGGASTSTYHCYYQQDLYTDPGDNTYAVMNAAFREQFKDSDGQPLKLTWWMHGGNMFRHASNQNVPYSNLIALHLMKKYHGQAVTTLGDELSMHYHTWNWTDYNGDGMYYWNQTPTFNECRDDFDYTIAQYLVEEEEFPVSFRSGWHFMDDDWQNYLDQLLPFSMHNDYPHKRTETEEPIDNIYDWSRSSPWFEPFHPSLADYQVPGDARGWNVRSIYMKRGTPELLNGIFERAQQGIDQVACMWSHLPENDFAGQIQFVHESVMAAKANYPDVDFYYCTAIEAMQRWLKTDDTEAPELQIEQSSTPENTNWTFSSNEPIFQPHPVVAVKDIYERYYLLDCNRTAENTWQAQVALPPDQLAKMAVTICDTVGNQTIETITYLPEDRFIDNQDPEFTTLTANFGLTQETAWGTDAPVATISSGDSAQIVSNLPVMEKRNYRLFAQMAPAKNLVDSFSVKIVQNDQSVLEEIINGPFLSRNWIFLTAVELDPLHSSQIFLTAKNTSEQLTMFTPDVIKLSAIIPARKLKTDVERIDFGAVSLRDTVKSAIQIRNGGDQDLVISNISVLSDLFQIHTTTPQTIGSFEKTSIELSFSSDQLMNLLDTLKIYSNDPIRPIISIPLTVSVSEYFKIVDNEDSGYFEEGSWQTSVAQAWGNSSRYIFLNAGSGTFAGFTSELAMDGIYEIAELLPETVNSANAALYEISLSQTVIDSIYLDQNENSGSWCSVGKYYLPANVPVTVRVINDGSSTYGDVMRADAIRFQLLEEINDISESNSLHLPQKTQLLQNYPNPFNPSTVIRWQLAVGGMIELTIYNQLGQKIATPVKGNHEAGSHSFEWHATSFASGIYYYVLTTSSFRDVKKMMLLR